MLSTTCWVSDKGFGATEVFEVSLGVVGKGWLRLSGILSVWVLRVFAACAFPSLLWLRSILLLPGHLTFIYLLSHFL